jgi:transcriptional regulator with XRE-family HTH domain
MRMTEGFGDALRRTRLAAGLSQPRLAAAVHFSQSLISKVENGAEHPSYEFARACDDALGAGGQLLSLVGAPRPTSGDTEIEAWELADALTRSSISLQTLDHMEHAIHGHAARYPSSAPAALMVPVQQQLRRLRHALTQPQTLEVRRRAVRLVGVLSGLAGHLRLDTGREDHAVTFFELGRLAGHEAADDDLTAWVLATHSIAPFFAGRPAEAATLLDEASDLAVHASGPRRRAWIEALRARAHAAIGDRAGSLSSLEAARAAIDSVTDPPHGTDFFDAPRLAGLAGGTYLLLRDTEPATEMLTQALASRAPADTKGRADHPRPRRHPRRRQQPGRRLPPSRVRPHDRPRRARPAYHLPRARRPRRHGTVGRHQDGGAAGRSARRHHTQRQPEGVATCSGTSTTAEPSTAAPGSRSGSTTWSYPAAIVSTIMSSGSREPR